MPDSSSIASCSASSCASASTFSSASSLAAPVASFDVLLPLRAGVTGSEPSTCGYHRKFTAETAIHKAYRDNCQHRPCVSGHLLHIIQARRHRRDASVIPYAACFAPACRTGCNMLIQPAAHHALDHGTIIQSPKDTMLV